MTELKKRPPLLERLTAAVIYCKPFPPYQSFGNAAAWQSHFLCFPQMPKLALGKNTGNAIGMPPHYRLIRRKGFAIKPPPLIL